MDASATVFSGHIDWGLVGLLATIGAVILAVPLSIVGNLLTRKVDAFLERRMLTKTNRSKEQELANYKRVEKFKNGTRDRYPYYILLATAAVISALGSATCLILVILKYWDVSDFPSVPLLMASLFAFLFGILAAAFMSVIAEIARHIEHFEQYQEEIRKKWGDRAI
jgi:MFS family permease